VTTKVHIIFQSITAELKRQESILTAVMEIDWLRAAAAAAAS